MNTSGESILNEFPRVAGFIARRHRDDLSHEMLRLLMEVSRLRRVNLDLQRQRAELRKQISYHEMLNPSVSPANQPEGTSP